MMTPILQEFRFVVIKEPSSPETVSQFNCYVDKMCLSESSGVTKGPERNEVVLNWSSRTKVYN